MERYECGTVTTDVIAVAVSAPVHILFLGELSESSNLQCFLEVIKEDILKDEHELMLLLCICWTHLGN